MPSPDLVINESHRGYRITWYFPEEDHIGANLGEERISDIKSPSERHEIKAMHTTALRTQGVERDMNGFRWPEERLASAARRAVILAAKKAAKTAKDEPSSWPKWAIKAKDEGWKPPKGWKP
jgi:hypothetical protein